MKYGDVDSAPVVVTPHVLIIRWYWSAVARQVRALAASPCTSAIVAAAISPAISAAMVEGE